MPIRTQTSVGMETPDETMARARDMLARSQQQTGGASPSPIQSPTPATQMQPTGDISIPSPQAPAIEEEFLSSVQGQVQQTRQTVEQSLQQRRQEIEQERAELISQRDQIMQDDVQPLTEPFREDLERTERERLQVNENFEANQRLVGELEQLLTEGNNLIRMQQGLPVNQRVVNARMNNAMRDVEARAGVLQAVMNARNNQISQALTMIDRTKEAIVADRQDQLNYFNAILSAKDQRILTLDKEDQKRIDEQLELVQRDLARAEATADYIKELMIDPQTAQFMADAGVTMTDSIEQINQKMRDQSIRQEKQDIKNAMAEADYDYVPNPNNTNGLVGIEVDGETMYFRVRPGSSTALGQEMQRAQIAAQRESAATSRVNRLATLAGLGDVDAMAELGITPENPNYVPTFEEFTNSQLGAGLNNLFDRTGGLLSTGTLTGGEKQQALRTVYESQIVRPQQERQALDDVLRNVVAGAPKHEREFIIEQHNALLNEGRIEDAKNYLAHVAASTAGQTSFRQFEGRQAIINTLNDIESMLDSYIDAGGSIGRGTVAIENIASRFGRTTDPELVRMENRINAAVVAYTNAVAGAQFSEAEAERYQALFPSIGNKMSVNRPKIDALRSQVQVNQDQFLANRVGQTQFERLYQKPSVSNKDADVTSNPTTFQSSVSGRTYNLTY